MQDIIATCAVWTVVCALTCTIIYAWRECFTRRGVLSLSGKRRATREFSIRNVGSAPVSITSLTMNGARLAGGIRGAFYEELDAKSIPRPPVDTVVCAYGFDGGSSWLAPTEELVLFRLDNSAFFDAFDRFISGRTIEVGYRQMGGVFPCKVSMHAVF